MSKLLIDVLQRLYDNDYRYIARDDDIDDGDDGMVFVYEGKPSKGAVGWRGDWVNVSGLETENDKFPCKWSDDEPTLISELIMYNTHMDN